MLPVRCFSRLSAGVLSGQAWAAYAVIKRRGTPCALIRLTARGGCGTRLTWASRPPVGSSAPGSRKYTGPMVAGLSAVRTAAVSGPRLAWWSTAPRAMKYRSPGSMLVGRPSAVVFWRPTGRRAVHQLVHRFVVMRGGHAGSRRHRKPEHLHALVGVVAVKQEARFQRPDAAGFSGLAQAHKTSPAHALPAHGLLLLGGFGFDQQQATAGRPRRRHDHPALARAHSPGLQPSWSPARWCRRQ